MDRPEWGVGRGRGTDEEPLGVVLARLREERGFGPAALARLAAVPRASLRDWETGRHAPSVAALERLLAALAVDARTRARLLAETGSPEARVLLDHGPWGAPVGLGAVLRAMRLRAERTQADLAGEVGVRQGTLAKWEAGDATPADDALERTLLALRAIPAERAALLAAWPGLAEPLVDPWDRIDRIAHSMPIALRDVLLLGLEAELWRRAMRDPSADAPLARAMAVRAQQALVRGAWDEIGPHVRRAVRLARASGEIDGIAPGLYAWNWVRQRHGEGPTEAARSLARWAGRMRTPPMRNWLTAAQALALVRAGEIASGIRTLERFLDREGEGTGGRRYYGEDLVEAWLLAGEPERAHEVLGRLGGDATPVAAAKVAVARGETPPPDLLDRLRLSDDAISRDEARRIGRLAARVRRGRAPRLD